MAKISTIKDVASRANVSIATVSRVINHSGSVNPILAERVQQAIQDLNYSPNIVARSLKTSNTATIAFLVSNISDPYFITIGRGIEDYIKGFGYNLIVCSIGHSQEKEIAYLQLLKEKKVDGLILNTVGYNDDIISELSQNTPIVLSNRRINSASFNGDFVDSDNIGGVYALTKCLLAAGHRKIGTINGPSHLSTASERYRGFCNAMNDHGIAIEQNYLYQYEGLFNSESGYHGAKILMEQNSPPSAIILMSSEIALGAMRYFSTNKISIPNDVSIVCFGDIPNREILYINPTVAATNLTGMGMKMGELLLERIQAKERIANREICFTTQIYNGNSVMEILP